MHDIEEQSAPSMSRPTQQQATPPTQQQSLQSNNADEDDSGLPGWGVALIVLSVLLIIGCGIYHALKRQNKLMTIGMKGWNKGSESNANNQSQQASQSYSDDEMTSQAETTRRSNDHPKSDSIEHASYGSRRVYNNSSSRSYAPSVSRYGKKGRDPTMYIPGNKVGRDPTLYVPGQEDRPDPDTGSVVKRKSEKERGAAQDAVLKPRLDP